MAQELGRELTEWAMLEVRRNIAHADIEPPRECHGAVSSQFQREERELNQRVPWDWIVSKTEEITGKDFDMVFGPFIERLENKYNP